MKKQVPVSKLILLLLFLIAKSSLIIAQEEQPNKLIPVGDEAYEAILQFYQYDKDIPLQLRVVDSEENEIYKREKIVFTGINNSRVVGYLATPTTGEQPYPCVLQMHGLNVSKSDYWEENYYHHSELVTKGLLSSGYAVLALDMPYHGDRLYESDFESPVEMLFKNGWGYRIRDMAIQSTIEYRRALDYLETRQDIDSNRIGAIGYSFGSVVTFILTGVDERIKSTVVCATAFIKPRSFFPPKEHLSGFAPQNFVRSFNNRPFLMLAAENDNFNCTVDEAKQLFNMVEGKNKELLFYDSKHKLPKEHALAAVDWFIRYLK